MGGGAGRASGSVSGGLQVHGQMKVQPSGQAIGQAIGQPLLEATDPDGVSVHDVGGLTPRAWVNKMLELEQMLRTKRRHESLPPSMVILGTGNR